MNEHKYILDANGEPIAEPDLMKWAEWFEKHDNRKIARTDLKDHFVSTIFLSLDFSEVPLLFETMVFEKKESVSEPVELFGHTLKGFKFHKSLDQFTDRYYTKKEALIGHEAIVEQVKEYERT